MAPIVTIHNPIHKSLHLTTSKSYCAQEGALRCLLFVLAVLGVKVQGGADVAVPQHPLYSLWIDLSFIHQPG